jgi:CRP-like cAMP-binding protein
MEMENLQHDVEALRQMPLFAGLPPARLKLIAYAAEALHIAAGEVLVREGDPADAVYVITDGQAEVSLQTREGRAVILRSIGGGGLFGETAVLAGTPRTATVTATTAVTALRIGAPLFRELLQENPLLALGVAELLAQRLASERRVLTDAATGR